jgi:hypothetical protein
LKNLKNYPNDNKYDKNYSRKRGYTYNKSKRKYSNDYDDDKYYDDKYKSKLKRT